MNEYEDYEKECDSIRKENKEIISEFELWLRNKRLSDKTINKHRDNVEFYISEYLLYEEPKRPSEGVNEIGLFLGYWFIRKAMWANETNIKSNATSLKKFYAFMYERGEVELDDINEIKERIKEGLPEWIETVKRYDDPSVDIEDVWQW